MTTTDSDLANQLQRTIALHAYGIVHCHEPLKARVVTSLQFNWGGGPFWYKALVDISVLRPSSHVIERTVFRRRIAVSHSRRYGVTRNRGELVCYEPGLVFDKQGYPVYVTEPLGTRLQLAGCWFFVDISELEDEDIATICEDFKET